MTVLVFGGLGHVGSWITHDLAASGRNVVVIDCGRCDISAPALRHLEFYKDRIVFENVDALDMRSLFERMRAYEDRIDCVVWSIAVIAGPTFAERPFRNVEINTVGMLNCLEACRILKVPKFVNLSSGALYGAHSGNQCEDAPIQVTDLYGATKAANEAFARQYGKTYGIDVRHARLSFVYGPGRLPSAMHPLYQAMFGPIEGLRDVACPSGADQALDWTHVRDSAAGVLALIDAPAEAEGEAFNISSGVAYPHEDILAASDRIAGVRSGNSLGPGPYLRRGAPLDISKAKSLLNLRPRFTDIENGLQDYATWIRCSGC